MKDRVDMYVKLCERHGVRAVIKFLVELVSEERAEKSAAKHGEGRG